MKDGKADPAAMQQELAGAKQQLEQLGQAATEMKRALDVEQAKSVIVLKRSMNPGFAGIDNALFYLPRTSMLFGDAKASLARLVQEIKQA